MEANACIYGGAEAREALHVKTGSPSKTDVAPVTDMEPLIILLDSKIYRRPLRPPV
jgi:hypothetical protein